MKIELSKNRDLVEEIRHALKVNGGYCPCKTEKTEDTKCICKEFRNQDKEGECHCGLYNKVNT